MFGPRTKLFDPIIQKSQGYWIKFFSYNATLVDFILMVFKPKKICSETRKPFIHTCNSYTCFLLIMLHFPHNCLNLPETFVLGLLLYFWLPAPNCIKDFLDLPDHTGQSDSTLQLFHMVILVNQVWPEQTYCPMKMLYTIGCRTCIYICCS